MSPVPSVEIQKTFGVDISDVETRKHNIWIGISISNKLFTKGNTEALMRFSLAYTKEKILVLVPGRMQATNYRYFDNMRRSEALRKGFEDEEIYKKMIGEILDTFSEEERNKIEIVNYDNVCTPKHIAQREVFFRSFAEQGTFYEVVMDIMKETIINRGRTFEVGRAESLALYMLHELPFYTDGIQKNYSDTRYTLTPYPGSGRLDDLYMDVIEGKKFPKLTQQLQLQHLVGILDVAFV